MPHPGPGDVLAGRYRLVDLLTESGAGRFWRAHDRVLERHVAVHVISADDARAAGLMEAARRSATVLDRRVLRVLDADTNDKVCYVVNEWGSGTSLDIVVAGTGALGPRRSAWLVSEVAEALAVAHAAGVAHGRLNPENVIIDRAGGVRIIGLCVDAALHGLPTDRLGTDVTDLAGLLYCLLTTKWAGASGSLVPPAPREHGEVLRPRRVRAGIPRPLDSLCAEVLNPQLNARDRDLGDVTSARGIADFLREFVGDPTGMADALVASTPAVLPDEELIVLPPVPEMEVRDPGPHDDVRADEPAELDEHPATAVPAEASDVVVDELPTAAGMPIFGEEDVSWWEKRPTPPPPPPPFDEPPERPLFAPTPPDGAPLRTAREDATPATGIRPGDEFWPFETGTGRGSHAHPTAAEDDDDVPGRRWFRLAAALLAAVVVLVIFLVALNLGRGKTVLGGDPTDDESDKPRSTRSASPQVGPITGLTATVLDPQGTDGGEENNDEAPLAVDGDAGTAWTTSTYRDQFGPPLGLKTGVGLAIDLGGAHDVTSVALRLVGSPTDVELYLTDEAPTAIADLTPVAEGTADGTDLTLDLDEATSGSFLVVWLTSLPADGSDFRGSIAEVVVRGE